MGWFDSFFEPEKGYEKGQEQLDKYYQEGKAYLTPYNEFGRSVHPALSGAMNRLLNPVELESDWTKSYQESPAALQAEKMAQQHGLNAASSMGLGGSNTALQAIQEGTSRIGMQDRENWLNRIMQKYLAGTTIGQNIFNTGASSANTLATNAANMGNNSAQMSYGQQTAPGEQFGSMLGKGLGWLAGGPVGETVGSKLSGWLFGD